MGDFKLPQFSLDEAGSGQDVPPLTANDLSIPVEAYAASTSYAIDPSLELGPELWDEVDRANAARVDELNNQFIDRQREILHIGDDAFFKQTGRDAILNAPAIHARLAAARQETLGRASNDVQREWLGETLDKHKIVEHFDIGDHVGRQSLAWQRSINRRRLDLLNRQAGIDHADPRMIEALAHASESSARDHARASGHRPDSPEAQAEVDIARSAVFRHAIEGALAKGAHAVAIKLHERAKGKLIPGDAKLLDKMIEAAREMDVGKEYVAKIAPTSAMKNRSVADLDKMQAEATTRNNEDWKDNEAQRGTNQHFINVQFAKAKRQVEVDETKLAQTVHDWLTTPGPDGRLRTGRPPFMTWAKLTWEEQQAVDSILKENVLRPADGNNAQGVERQILGVSPHDDRPFVEPTVGKMDGDALPTLLPANAGSPAATAGGAGAAGESGFAKAVRNLIRLTPLAGPAALAALPLMFIPTNSQSETIDLGPGLRARRRPGQRTVEIEKLVDKGIGSQWETLPVPAEIVNQPDGRQVIGIDVDKLEQFVAPQTASRLRSQAVPAFPGQEPPLPLPLVLEMRIGTSTDGGVTTSVREATKEEVEEFCYNYPHYQKIAEEASRRVEALGLKKGFPHGLYVHKQAELDILKMSKVKEIMDELGIEELRPEFALLEGRPQSYSVKGVSKLDVLEILRKKTICVYDFKTGRARFPDQTIRRYGREAGEYSRWLGRNGYDRIYVIPIHVP